MPKTINEKIDSIKANIEQLENQHKKLIQQQKEQERKARTQRSRAHITKLEKWFTDEASNTAPPNMGNRP
jgi:t-SNARE complex subunit (syntaxin)